NLYLTVLVTGLAVRLDWISLAARYAELEILGNWWIIGVAGAFFVVEFFADKVPWLDSAWDSMHTVIRPAGGILLALAALGELDPVVSVVAALLFGGVSLVTHSAKAGARLLINTSPEPVTNTAASVAEDGIVLGGLALLGVSPTVAFFVFLVLSFLAGMLAVKTWKLLWRGMG
ncbi:MAG: DUF4126 domain-containing protein, partial [Akkermansiaceae bacterium]|nr:DUF4126 domain-containing protein [Akkermansiaceae bacterium]